MNRTKKLYHCVYLVNCHSSKLRRYSTRLKTGLASHTTEPVQKSRKKWRSIMKITCDVIKDILPLYAENMISADTKMIVDEHISSCHDCEKKLSD